MSLFFVQIVNVRLVRDRETDEFKGMFVHCLISGITITTNVTIRPTALFSDFDSSIVVMVIAL